MGLKLNFHKILGSQIIFDYSLCWGSDQSWKILQARVLDLELEVTRGWFIALKRFNGGKLDQLITDVPIFGSADSDLKFELLYFRDFN